MSTIVQPFRVRTYWPACEAIGFDMGKRTCGRKRRILVDTCGLLLKLVLHAANVQGPGGAKLVLAGLSTAFPLVGPVWVDGGYVNSVNDGLIGWAKENAGVRLEAVSSTNAASRR